MKRLILALLLITSSASAEMRVWADHGTVKLRQQGDYTGTGQQAVRDISLKCAKNEFEPFQIFVYADGETLAGVDVTVSNLTKAGGGTVDNIYIYKQAYLNITSPSRADYLPGLWPDPLLPKVDRYYGETRNAFPFGVSSGNVQGVWIDLGTTASTAAGTYTGTYTVTASGKTPITGNITLQVHNFAIPSTASQRNMWMISESALDDGFMGASQSTAWTAEKLALLRKAALYHRISLNTKGAGVLMAGIGGDGTVTFGSNFTSAFAPALSGTAITSGPYAGAKQAAQNIELAHTISASFDTSETKWRTMLQSYWDFFTAQGWEPKDRLYAYTVDEPTGATVTYRGEPHTDYEVVLHKTSDMNSVNTGGAGTWVNTFTTENRNPAGPQNALTLGGFDTNGLWCPLYVHYEYTDNQGASYRNARDTYPDLTGWPTREHWAYASNMNLTLPQVDWNTESPAAWTRALGWVDWTYRVTGDLYYQTNVLWGSPYEPYVNTKVEGVNGQANSVYPGVASKTGRSLPFTTPEIGGTTDIPIESIKWKLYRESQEDFEYMEILRAAGQTAAVDAIVDTVYRSTPYTGGHGKYYSVSDNAALYFAARDAMAALITGEPAPPATPIAKLHGKLNGKLH